jgi:hypothetical protein
MIRKTLFLATVLAFGFARGAMAGSTPEPFADMDNDGVFGPGDVEIGKLLSNDGQFDVTRSEGSWQGTTARVGVVFPGRFASRKRVLVVKATGDIAVHGSVGAAGQGGVVVLLSTGGKVVVDDGVRVTTDSILQLIGQDDVEIGDMVQLLAKSGDFSMVSLASQSGDVIVGSGVNIGADGMVELATGRDVGGSIRVAKGSRMTSGSGHARVTAGGDVDVQGLRLSAQDVLIGSYSTTRSVGRAGAAGYVGVRNSLIKAPHGQVQMFADGDGGTIDITKTSVTAGSRDAVTLNADVIVR